MTTTRASLRRTAAGAAAIRRERDTAREPAEGAVGTRRTIQIERIAPSVDGGRHLLKRVVGDRLLVTADIFADGHDLLSAVVRLRPVGPATGGPGATASAEEEARWREAPMRLVENDRWSGSLTLEAIGRHVYRVEAWRDSWGSLCEAIGKKVEASVGIATELAEARLMLEAARTRADLDSPSDARRIGEALTALRRARSERTAAAAVTGDELLAVMRRHPDRSWSSRSAELPLMVDRERARSGAWYELFPRSQGRAPGQATTLREAEWRLPAIAAMGFDVVYLPPIHPIGRVNRKGRNNSLQAGPDDPGSPWAIGSSDGGHADVAPELGGLAAWDHFRRAVERNGMELAFDLALQAAPDHPWVTEHPEWFRHAPDGTIKYAENPPKKYQDIYPIDFYGTDAADREALWRAWLDVVETWVERGVRIFRVDNPHTKPVPFWEWLIGEVQSRHPDVVFLSEAFTRPAMMRALAKVGFSQSYTYFTWRETAWELRDYLTELTGGEMRDYFRGNLFVNTPDINPHHLDHGRPVFEVRAVLAATLSSSWGMYSGYELCESRRFGDREEYADSEKYEIRHRDWEAPGNIVPLVTALNRLRGEQPALRTYEHLRFEGVSGERILFYRKAMPAGEPDPLTGYPFAWRDPVYVAANVDPRSTATGTLHPDLPAIGIGWTDPYRIIDLLTGEVRAERGADVAIELTPTRPFRIFTIAPR